LKTQFDVLICDLDVQDFTGKEILPAKHAKYAKNKTQKINSSFSVFRGQ